MRNIKNINRQRRQEDDPSILDILLLIVAWVFIFILGGRSKE